MSDRSPRAGGGNPVLARPNVFWLADAVTGRLGGIWRVLCERWKQREGEQTQIETFERYTFNFGLSLLGRGKGKRGFKEKKRQETSDTLHSCAELQ
jgi:hypothetical protein